MSGEDEAPAPKIGGRGLGRSLGGEHVENTRGGIAAQRLRGHGRTAHHLVESDEVEPIAALVTAIAYFILEHRRQGGMSAREAEAVLAAFPAASSDDYEAGRAGVSGRAPLRLGAGWGGAE